MNAVAKSVLGCIVAIVASVTVCQAGSNVSVTGGGSVTNMRVEERPTSEFPPATSITLGDETLVDAQSFNLYLDSANDILLVDAALTVTAGSVFNETNPAAAANDHSPPVVTICSVFRSQCIFQGLSVDLWLTTPGGTSPANSNALDQGMLVTHFDTSRDTDLTDFHFAHLTLVPDEHGNASAVLSGEIQTSNASREIEYNQFSVTMSFGTVPEPEGMGLALTALLSMLGVVRSRRSS